MIQTLFKIGNTSLPNVDGHLQKCQVVLSGGSAVNSPNNRDDTLKPPNFPSPFVTVPVKLLLRAAPCHRLSSRFSIPKNQGLCTALRTRNVESRNSLPNLVESDMKHPMSSVREIDSDQA